MEPHLLSELELRKAIRTTLSKQNFEKKIFVPKLALYSLLSAGQIKAVLSAYLPEHDLAETASVLFHNGRKILAILIQIELIPGAISFISHGIEDSHLPLSQDLVTTILKNKGEADQFYRGQWTFTAPTFSRRTLWRFLPSDTILPITGKRHLGSGGFGDVYEIVVEPSYQTFDNVSQIVLKKFKADVSFTSYTEELENLSKLKHMQHPNILPLLACYTYGDEHNLIFPLAAGGDLCSFLKQPPTQHFQSFENLLASLAGLASGLSTVHNFHSAEFHTKSIGCHRDLRPHNVLVNGPEFILTDFGLARIRQIPESSQSLYRTGRGYYLAPECQSLDGIFQKHLVNRSSDIWSFGCIMLELWTHHLRGPEGVQAFFEHRKFTVGVVTYRLFHHGTTASVSVHEWLDQLQSQSEADDSASEVAVRFGTLIRNMLSMNPQERPTASEVTDELQFVALFATASNILPDFKPLSDIIGLEDSVLELEKRRFKSLLDVFRLTDVGFTRDNSISLDTVSQLAGFRRTLKCFHDIQDELCEIQERLIHLKVEEHGRRFLSLRHLITTLFHTLPRSIQSKSRSRLELEHDLFLAQNTDLQNFSNNIWRHESSEDVWSHLVFLTAMKKSTATEGQRLLSEKYKESKELATWPKMDPMGSGGHITGYVQDSKAQAPRYQVLIEKKGYADHVAREKTRLKLDTIYTLLSSEAACHKLRVLKCRGFYHDQNAFSFGLVFDFPTCSDETPIAAITLESILKKRSRLDKPTLKGRFQMASQLAHWLSDLHYMKWFHKNLCSKNIVFFNPVKATIKDLTSPYIVGFAYSRPDEIFLFSEGPPQPGSSYQAPQHPDYRSGLSFYTHEYDYYGLGLILLEIGLWAHLDDIAENSRGDRHEFVLQKKVPLLGASMGSRYQEVVQKCLDFNFSRDGKQDGDEAVNRNVHLCFRDVVVDALSELAGFNL